VFDKVLVGSDSVTGGVSTDWQANVSLREQAVSVLFSRSRLSSLQRQVMLHPL
jgi:hypothetical protein